MKFNHHIPEMVEFHNEVAKVEILSQLGGWNVTVDCEPCSVSQYSADNY